MNFNLIYYIRVSVFGKDEELNIILNNEEIVTGRCYPDGPNRVVLTFDGDVPAAEQLVEFKLANDAGNVFGAYKDYGTVYQALENGYILSNDGSVYEPPAEPDPEPVYEPTLDELKIFKKQEVSAACEQTIASGVDVQLPSGVEHFALTANDQINLIGSQAAVTAGEQQIAYHEDGQPCRYYTPDEIGLIVQQTMFWIGYHRTYCNSINMWIQAAESKDDLQKIYYGADVPTEYQSEVLKDYLAKIAASAKGDDVSEAVS